MIRNKRWPSAFLVLLAACATVFLAYCALLTRHNQASSPTSRPTDSLIEDSAFKFIVQNLSQKIHPVSSKRISPPAPRTVGLAITDEIGVEDVCISVKTTAKFHDSRIKMIIQTWFPLARNTTYIFTDVYDRLYEELTDGHMINTKCGQLHNRQDLICKMDAELTHYYHLKKKWFCHFDDDNYVNIPVLLSTLSTYDHTSDIYLGRTSMSKKAKSFNKETKNWVSYEFATGGAGFCISQSLMHKLLPYMGEGRMQSISEKWIKMPDDVSLGFVITYLLKIPLTELPTFHSHLERLASLTKAQIREQISLSYGTWTIDGQPVPNRVVIFPTTAADQTGLRSVHCYLYPKSTNCADLQDIISNAT